MGSGTTAVAARLTGRSFVGYETDPQYVGIAHRRLSVEAGSDIVDARGQDHEVRTLRDIVTEVLRSASCDVVEWNARIVSGMEVSGRARAPQGREFFFDIVGGAVPGRAGLARGDLMWREIGRAAVVSRSHPSTPLVVFSAGVPEKSGGAAALGAVVGADRPIAAVVHVTDPLTAARSLAHELDEMFPSGSR